MCKVLNITKSMYYHKSKKQSQKGTKTLENAVIQEFKASRNNYGTRKIKAMLGRNGIIISRHKVCKIISKYWLVSSYTKKQFKSHKNEVNEDKTTNLLERKFNNINPL